MPVLDQLKVTAPLGNIECGWLKHSLGPMAVLLCLIVQTARAEDAEQVFVRRVLPLLNQKCLPCHGQDEKDIKGSLDLRSRMTAAKGGDSELPGLVPGKPQESGMYLAAARTSDEWSPMPPKEADQLTAEQLAWIKDWVAGGAPWPDAAKIQEIAKSNADKWSAEDGVPVKTSGGLSADWTNRKYQPDSLWAYQPVQKPEVEGTGAKAIDELVAQHIPPGFPVAAPAEARTFIRRATFNLTGLPATPEEIQVFESEYSKDADAAVERLIDRLLASPHYGERMAQHWLDVVRYADSSGFANDYERGNAWRYRDYVIRAFNGDKPYDDFIREQIAGDEIAPDDPEKIIATGFLRMGPWELTGMEVAKVARQRFLDDVTNSVGETFLAHSLQCARCHDHKFDPVPTRDYYSIQAVFATTQLAERSARFLPQENKSGFEERRYLTERQAHYQKELAELDQVQLDNAEKWFEENNKDASRWQAEVSEILKQTSNNQKRYTNVFTQARTAMMKAGIPQENFPPKLVGFTPEQFGRERVARKGLERLRWELDRYEPFALAVYSGRTPDVKSVNAPTRVPANRMSSGELEESCILTGGDPFSSGQPVNPGVLSVLKISQPAIPEAIAGRRKAFADWVADPENALTARAIVNRVWMWHFGEPLAGNPNNFGSTGKRPTHPELLDWLAATFVEEGWSFKSLHRQIMTSAAYRRSGSLPPVKSSTKTWENIEAAQAAYAVFRPRRLSAEELRDTMLAVTGELNRTLGGIPNRPEINLEAALQPRQVMGTFAAAWVPNPKPAERHRRSIYALKLRGLPDPALEVFNTPAPDFSCERREVSTVTPQVFSLFNSQNTYARALAMADRVLKELDKKSKTDTDRRAIDRCFQLAFGRSASQEELTLCLAHWKEMEALHAKVLPRLTEQPLTVRREAVEENTGEKFTFQESLPANLDFVPDLQPADCNARTRGLAEVCLSLMNTNEFVYVY